MENSPYLFIDMLVAIALRTTDPIDILNQRKVNREMLKNINTQFWNTWMHLHNPERLLIIDVEAKTAYNQLFLTSEVLTEKLYVFSLIKMREHIDKLIIEKKPADFNIPGSMEYRIKDNITSIRVDNIRNFVDTLSIIEFHPVPNIETFTIVIKMVEIVILGNSANVIGVYTDDEIEAVKTKYEYNDWSSDEEEEENLYMIKINMKDFKIGEFTTELLKEFKINIESL